MGKDAFSKSVLHVNVYTLNGQTEVLAVGKLEEVSNSGNRSLAREERLGGLEEDMLAR